MNLTRIVKNLFFLLVAVFSGMTLVVITAGVASGAGELTPFDTGIERAISLVRTPPLTSVMLFVTNIGSPFLLAMVSILLAIALVLKRDTYDTLLYMVAIALSIVSFILMKNALGIPRPAQSLVAELSGWSFPSGHATVATAFFFVTGYSFINWIRSITGKVVLVVSCVAAVLLISFSRIYLVAHFALDVLAGIALGLLVVSATVLIFNVFLSEREWWRRQVRSF
jgi:undecaprenyl-diphosphatase